MTALPILPICPMARRRITRIAAPQIWMFAALVAGPSALAVENIRLSDRIVALGNDIGFDNFARGELVDPFTVVDVALSDDGSRVVYVADDDFEGVQELYSVPVTGGDPVKLHPPLAPPADSKKDVVAFAIAPGQDLVVYLLGQQNLAPAELWVAPIDGSGDPYRLRPEAEYPEPGVARFLLTPDESQVVFNGRPPGSDDYGLYSVPIDASSDPVELGAGPVQNSVGSRSPVKLWEVCADGGHVAYVSKRQAVVMLSKTCQNDICEELPNLLHCESICWGEGAIRSCAG